jgi:hypothetical protein
VALMNNQVAVIVTGALIAGAIALTNHWAVVIDTSADGQGRTLRLNRWTGTIVLCGPLGAEALAGGQPTWELPCPSPIPLRPGRPEQLTK